MPAWRNKKSHHGSYPFKQSVADNQATGILTVKSGGTRAKKQGVRDERPMASHRRPANTSETPALSAPELRA
jgi:hypothetical protein